MRWFSVRPPRSRLTAESGQGLIELALTLPFLMLILLGAAEFARFAWASIETTNAARAGVQYGAQTDITASDDSGMQTAALNDGVNLSRHDGDVESLLRLLQRADYSRLRAPAPSAAVPPRPSFWNTFR